MTTAHSCSEHETHPEIIVKFHAGVVLPNTAAAVAGDPTYQRFKDWLKSNDASKDATIRQCFPLLAERLRCAALSPGPAPAPPSAIDRFVSVLIPGTANPTAPVCLARDVSLLEGVEYAAVAPQGECPPQTQDHTKRQRYLKNGRGRIGAEAAWNLKGGAGDAVNVCVCDHGFRSMHEDLPQNVSLVLPPQGALPQNQNGLVGTPDWEHGTMVLGVLAAVKDQKGVTGISHAVGLSFAPVDDLDRKGTIDAAINSLAAGDVLVLEMQAAMTRPDGTKVAGPQEFDPAIREALKEAASLGIVVVAAAGNGGTDLGTISAEIEVNGQPRFARIWDRDRLLEFDDSGAILVGAGRPNDQTRVASSNFGNRIDCQGWGQGIVTTGSGSYASNLPDSTGKPPVPDATYTKAFGQTSGATAMVAGVVACLQGARTGAGKARFDPAQMRGLVSDPKNGAPQEVQDAAQSPIGPLPNLNLLKREVTARP